MKAFISYASEYRKVADRIAIGLRQEGIDVFFDRDQLPPGGAYNTSIRKAIKQSDLFIFLISPESVSEAKIKIRGCPQTPMVEKLDGKHYLHIQPR